jgi:hypothetical protein
LGPRGAHIPLVLTYQYINGQRLQELWINWPQEKYI